jgi:hypothetical protein
MGLTRPTAAQINTVITTISDPITVLNQGSTLANIDVGLLMNRGGSVANVALFWDESANSFVTAFTTSSGTPNANITISEYANLRVSTLTATFVNAIGNIVSGGNLTVTGNLISPNIYSAVSGNINLNLYSSGLGQTYVSQSTGGAFGLNLAQDIVTSSNSARLYLLSSSGNTTIYNSGGTLFFNTSASPGTSSGFPQVKIAPTGTAVNWLQLTGSATGNAVPIAVDGTDSNIGLALLSKGTGTISFATNASTSTEQLRVSHTASAVNRVEVTGSATGGLPIISVQGSDANIPLAINSKGTSSIRLGFNNTDYLAINTATAGTNYIQSLGGSANIDIGFIPKGTGVVQFGTYTATVTAVAGYIQIKDSGGTLRKLAVLT